MTKLRNLLHSTLLMALAALPVVSEAGFCMRVPYPGISGASTNGCAPVVEGQPASGGQPGGDGQIYSLAFTNANPTLYEDTGVGSFANLFFSAQNQGTGPLTLSAPSLSGSNTTDYVLFTVADQTNCVGGNTLNVNDTCAVGVKFKPNSSGQKTATLRLPVANAATATVDMLGSGVGHPTLTFGGSDTYTFDGTSGAAVFTVSNTNDSPIQVGNPSITDTTNYSIISGTTCGTSTTTLQPGSGADASCDIHVAFNPTTIGTFPAVLSLSSTSGQTLALKNITSTNVAQANATRITVNTSRIENTYSFGNLVVNNPKSATFTVTNVGASTINVGLPTVSGLGYSLTGSTCTSGGTLAKNASCTINVQFRPTEIATYAAGSLTVAADNTTQIISLTGRGLGDPYFTGVVGLLHFDGPNGGQTFTDETGHTTVMVGTQPAATGGVDTTTATSVGGGASAAFRKKAGVQIQGLTIPAVGIDYTIEGFVRFNTYSTAASHYSPSNQYVFNYGASRFSFTWNSGRGWTLHTGTGVLVSSGNSLVPSSQWTHFAVVGYNGTTTVYLNGIAIMSTTNPAARPNGTTLTIGDYSNGGTYGVDGNIDEFRATYGTARYTDNFPVPAAPFPNN